MPGQNLQLVQAVFEALSDDGYDLVRSGDAAFELFYQPDVVLELSEWEIPGIAPIYRGIAGARRFWTEWLSVWDIEWNVEWHERGEFVVGVLDQRLRGSSSGVDIPIRYAQLFRFRDGKVEFWKPYLDPAGAFAAAGISAG